MEPKSSSRGSRQTQQKVVGKKNADDPPPKALGIKQENEHSGRVVLTLSGALDLETVGTLRDAAFTVIGTRPALLTIDTKPLGPLDIAAIEALNTISRVAKMVHVRFSVRVDAAERDVFDKTGLYRLLTIDDE